MLSRSAALNSVRFLTTFMLLLALSLLPATITATEESSSPEPEPAVEETPAKYLLRFKFEPNQKVTYKIKHENTRTLRKGEVIEIAYDKSEAVKHFTVRNVTEEGTAKLESMIDQVKLTTRFNNEGKPIVFDSTEPGQPPRVFKKVKDTIGKPLAETTFSARGAVLKTKNLLPNSQASTPTGNKKQKDSKPDPSLNFLLEFPEAPLSIDDRWSYTFEIHNLKVDKVLTKSARMKREYRLKDVQNEIATLTYKTTLLSPIRDPKVLTQLLEKTPSGTIKFDMKQGIIVSRTAELDKTEFGFNGSDSSMRAVSTRTETLASIETVEADKVDEIPKAETEKAAESN